MPRLLSSLSGRRSGGSTGSEGGDRPPPRLGPKKFIARPKNTHICKPPFACQNVLKPTYNNLEFQNFPEEDPRTTLFKGREGSGGKGGEREGKEGGEGYGREGRDGKGREGKREGGGEWGVVGRGGALDMGSALPRDKLWIRPWAPKCLTPPSRPKHSSTFPRCSCLTP